MEIKLTEEEKDEHNFVPKCFYINVKNNEFFPKNIKIPICSKVFFNVCEDIESNSNSLYYNSIRNNIISFDDLGIESQYLTANESFGIVFLRSGIYNYRSLIYSRMKGTVDVYYDEKGSKVESSISSMYQIDEIALMIDKFDDLLKNVQKINENESKIEEKSKQKIVDNVENKNMSINKKKILENSCINNSNMFQQKIKNRKVTNPILQCSSPIKMILRSLEPARGKEKQEFKEVEIILESTKKAPKINPHQKKKNKKRKKKVIENLFSKILNFENSGELHHSTYISQISEDKINLLTKF